MPPGAIRTPCASSQRHGGAQVVDPQADVVQRRRVHGRLAVGIDRLHEVDLDPTEPVSGDADVLVDVLALRPKAADHLEAELIDPQACAGAPCSGRRSPPAAGRGRGTVARRALLTTSASNSRMTSSTATLSPALRDQPRDDAVVRGDDDVLHLHRLDHRQPLAGAHRLPGRDRDVDQQARHRRQQEARQIGRRLEGHQRVQLGGARRRGRGARPGCRCGRRAARGRRARSGRRTARRRADRGSRCRARASRRTARRVRPAMVTSKASPSQPSPRAGVRVAAPSASISTTTKSSPASTSCPRQLPGQPGRSASSRRFAATASAISDVALRGQARAP